MTKPCEDGWNVNIPHTRTYKSQGIVYQNPKLIFLSHPAEVKQLLPLFAKDLPSHQMFHTSPPFISP